MTALLLQTLLLMLPAFFIGAALACGLRKLMQPAEEVVAVPARAQASAVEPLPQYAARTAATPTPAAPTVRAEPIAPVAQPAPAAVAPAPASVKTAPAGVAAAPSPAKPAAVAPQAPAAVSAAAAANRFDETLKARPDAAAPVAAAAVAVPAARPAPPPPAAPTPAAASAAPRPTPAVAATSTPTAEMIASAAAAMAAAAATVTAQANAAARAAPAPAAKVEVRPPAAAPAGVATAKTDAPASSGVVVPAMRDSVVAKAGDDLTRISVIDEALSAQLTKLGVTRFSQIAAWRKADVDGVSQALGYQGRIEQENWIEQAQILAGGGETFYSSRRSAAKSVKADAPPAAVVPPVVAPAPSPAPVAAAAVIAASQPKVEERAAFAQKPAQTAAPAAVAAGIAVPPDRMAIPAAASAPVVEQPAMKPAAPSAVPAAVAAAVVAAQAAASPAPAAVKVPDPAAVPPVVTVTPAAATAVRPSMAPTRDALQRIGSINAEIEKLLGAQGVTRYTQIAGWGASEIERFDRLLGSQGRIARENWVEQAQILAKGGDTAHSREFDRRQPAGAREAAVAAAARPKSITEAIKANAANMPPPAVATTPVSRPDISGLRSVRSEAYRPANDAATAAAAAAAAGMGSAKVVRSAEIDDLKRIRGIGVLIEKRLNSVGVVSYGQIAEWTNEDIDRVSATLDFKGRIERENWVEQARILAAGGQTEFSRRVDRGEVETSRPKS